MCAASMLFSTVCGTVSAQGFNPTPQQESILRGAQYNSGTELGQRIQEIIRQRTMKYAEKSYEEKKEEETAPEVQPTDTSKVPEIELALRKVIFTESKILSDEELKAIASKYEGKKIVIADLFKLCDEINELYFKKGYVTARAAVTPQKVTKGEVLITLVEGTVGKVSVVNNKYTKSSYVLKYAGLKTGECPQYSKLRNRLQRFNSTNTSALQMKMVAGELPGTTDVYIAVFEPEKRERVSLISDNSGKKNSGEWRYGLSYNNSNVSGNCDTMGFATLFSRTSETSMFNYNVPVDGRGNRVGVNYNSNRMRISDGDLKDLDIRGNSQAGGLSFIHPVITTSNRKDRLTIDAQKQKSETKILGTKFVDDDENRYTLSYDVLKINKKSLYYVRPSVTYCDYDGLGEDQNTTKYNLDGMWQGFSKKGDSVTLQLSGQKAKDDYIPSADMFYIGGIYSVRGYDESLLSGDSGFTLRLDYAMHTDVKGLRFITFADYGKITGTNKTKTDNLYSAGFGLEYREKLLAITATVGYALRRDINDTRVDASKFNLSVNYVF